MILLVNSEKVIPVVEDAIKNHRGVEVIRPLAGVLSHAGIIRNFNEDPHPVHAKLSDLVIKLINSELEYLKFREGFSGKWGLDLRIKRLYQLLDHGSSCCHHQILNKGAADKFKELVKLYETNDRRTLKYEPQDEFAEAVEKGNIMKASQWVSLHPKSALPRAMVGDILREKLDITAAKMKQLQNTQDKIILLETLFHFIQHYDHAINLYPSIEQSLTVMCSTLSQQIMGELSAGGGIKKKTRDCIQQLKSCGFISDQVVDAIDVSGGKHHLEKTPSGLTYADVNKKLDNIFNCYIHVSDGRRDIDKAAELSLELFEEENEILSLPHGQNFIKRFNDLKTIIYTEYFHPVNKSFNKSFNESSYQSQRSNEGKYKFICKRMAGFSDTCVKNQRFIFVLREEQSEKWKLTACKAWGYKLNAQYYKRVDINDLEHILQLRKIAPELPCRQTRNRFIQTVTQWLTLAQAVRNMPKDTENKLSELIDWCDQFVASDEGTTHEKQLLEQFLVAKAALESYGKITRRTKQGKKPVGQKPSGTSIRTTTTISPPRTPSPGTRARCYAESGPVTKMEEKRYPKRHKEVLAPSEDCLSQPPDMADYSFIAPVVLFTPIFVYQPVALHVAEYPPVAPPLEMSAQYCAKGLPDREKEPGKYHYFCAKHNAYNQIDSEGIVAGMKMIERAICLHKDTKGLGCKADKGVTDIAQKGIDSIREALLGTCRPDDELVLQQTADSFDHIFKERGLIDFEKGLDALLSQYIQQLNLTSYFQLKAVMDRLLYMRKQFDLHAP